MTNSIKKSKKLYLGLMLILISALYVWFIALDFSRFPSLNYNYDVYPSAILKRVNVAFAVAIAWSVGKDGLSRKDSNRLKAALIFAFLGEVSFAVGAFTLGIALFAVCQIMLIIRNSAGICGRLRLASCRQKLQLCSAAAAILMALTGFFLLLDSLTNIGVFTIIACIYGILLSVSLLSGLSNNILSLLPVNNSRMAAAGMLCFFCCDILVGLDAALQPGIPWLLANSFIWVFYIPALVLLALSGYKYY